jgi:hypothetical protein
MIWVAWRQQRAQILVTAGVAVVVAAVLVYVRSGVVSLLPDMDAISNQYNQFLVYLPFVMLVLPALLGVFAGAPLFAREIEQGTHVFGLTQSISRTRWWATKLAMAGLPLAVVMFALGLVLAWALEPMNFVMAGRLTSPLFEIQGVTVGAYSVLAFAVGTTAGLLLRNTLSAMVVTIPIYIAVRVAMANGARPRYAEPVYTQDPVGTYSSHLGSWKIEQGYFDVNGNVTEFSAGVCAVPGNFDDCLHAHGIGGTFSRWHPVERFWSFQLIEAGLFLALSAALLGLGAWALRRRLN